MTHYDVLAERIVALGDVPTVKPRPIEQADTICEILELDLKAETKLSRTMQNIETKQKRWERLEQP